MIFIALRLSVQAGHSGGPPGFIKNVLSLFSQSNTHKWQIVDNPFLAKFSHLSCAPAGARNVSKRHNCVCQMRLDERHLMVLESTIQTIPGPRQTPKTAKNRLFRLWTAAAPSGSRVSQKGFLLFVFSYLAVIYRKNLKTGFRWCIRLATQSFQKRSWIFCP